uniref:Uncharacterized protein n=1 Tax=Ignisphaera aggregans TaxID=334771 RepID=A0A7J3QDK1_9CREN
MKKDYYHQIIDDSYIKDVVKRIRILFHIEDLVELYINEMDMQEIMLRIDGLAEDDININKVIVYGEKVFIRCGYSEYYEDVEISFKCNERKGYILPEIYRTLGIRLAKNVVKRLSKYLFYNREYLIMVLDNGNLILLEGFQESITFPIISSIMFIAHTHPKTLQPIFSRKDLITTLEILSKRGIGSCVVSSTSLCILRKKPLTLDDYEKFEYLINSIEVATKDALDMAGFESLYTLNL